VGNLILLSRSTAGVIGIGGLFTAGVVAPGQIIAGVVDTSEKFAAGVTGIGVNS
jgi:hypothetical protein